MDCQEALELVVHQCCSESHLDSIMASRTPNSNLVDVPLGEERVGVEETPKTGTELY